MIGTLVLFIYLSYIAMEQADHILQQELERLTGVDFTRESNLRKKLAAFISELVVNDQHGLYFLLYRIDIPEKKIKVMLQQPHEDAALVIADLVIERQLQKIQLRSRFRQNPDNIPEEDKW